MIESPFSKTRDENQTAVFSLSPFLTAKSSDAEIQNALRSHKVYLDSVEAKKFTPAFRRAAANILNKQPEMNKISPALAAKWARKCMDKKRQPRQKPCRPDPKEMQREENRRYWTKILRERQGRNDS